MESYDDSLKYLIAEAPEDFFRFSLQESEVRVLGAAVVKLPSPSSRDIDAATDWRSAGESWENVHRACMVG